MEHLDEDASMVQASADDGGMVAQLVLLGEVDARHQDEREQHPRANLLDCNA